MIEFKICPDCNVEKHKNFFSKDKSKKTGLATYCKACYAVRSNNYYINNSEVMKNRSRLHYQNNKERHKENARKWVKNNRERHLNYRKIAHKKNYISGSDYAISHLVRAMMSRVVKASSKSKDFVTFEKIGYTREELRKRIECQFKTGMSWDNYGEWEIDHKIPVSIFISRGETRPEKINMLSNLQPMWAFDNRSKGARRVG